MVVGRLSPKWQPAAVACGFTPRSVRGVAAGAEPKVRIHLPPAASHQRTRTSAISLPLARIAIVRHLGGPAGTASDLSRCCQARTPSVTRSKKLAEPTG